MKGKVVREGVREESKFEDELISESARYNYEDSDEGLLYDIDIEYHDLYKKGMALSGTPDSGDKRKIRFYNLIQLLRSTFSLKGDVAECGSWKGLSSFLICNYLRNDNPEFSGEDYHIIDSFKGLSEPSDKDVISRDIVLKGIQRSGKPFKEAGAYSSDQKNIQQLLADYPDIQYHAGWVPSIFMGMKKRKYRFVHIDLDIYEPISSSLKYFYPLMLPGGLIVCDDYGSLFWPGARKAVDEFCIQHNVRSIALSSGQAVFIKTISPRGIASFFEKRNF